MSGLGGRVLPAREVLDTHFPGWHPPLARCSRVATKVSDTDPSSTSDTSVQLGSAGS